MREWNSHFFAFAETFAEDPLFDGDPGLFRRAVLKAVHGVQQTHHWSVNPFFTFCTMLHVAFSPPAAAAARWCMRSFRNRRHPVHLVRGPPLAQRLLHLLVLQVQHGQDRHRIIVFRSLLISLDGKMFACLHEPASGGEGLHHGRGGHHLPRVRQEEADGRHCGAVEPSLHPCSLCQ